MLLVIDGNSKHEGKQIFLDKNCSRSNKIFYTDQITEIAFFEIAPISELPPKVLWYTHNIKMDKTSWAYSIFWYHI